ncbi:MAG: VOC family protein [Rhizomicrobium sp.]
MKYVSMAAGFVLATLITLGASPGSQAAPAAQAAAPPDYVEFTVADMARSKAFYGAVFGWHFTDYGPAYASFDDGRIGGGFTTQGTPHPGGPLVVFYVADLDAALARVRAAGGTVVTPPFAFPGGRRFHFTDPDGTQIAAWSEK